MKIKVSNFIAQFLVNKGVTDAFSVVGGGAIQKSRRCRFL